MEIFYKLIILHILPKVNRNISKEILRIIYFEHRLKVRHIPNEKYKKVKKQAQNKEFCAIIIV